MKAYGSFIVAAVLVAMPGYGERSSVNQTDGVKDALNSRPHEGIRDAGEGIGDAVKDARKEIKNVGELLKDAVEVRLTATGPPRCHEAVTAPGDGSLHAPRPADKTS